MHFHGDGDGATPVCTYIFLVLKQGTYGDGRKERSTKEGVAASPSYGDKVGKNTDLTTPFVEACRQSIPGIATGAT
jgi:hypothetical protein